VEAKLELAKRENVILTDSASVKIKLSGSWSAAAARRCDLAREIGHCLDGREYSRPGERASFAVVVDSEGSRWQAAPIGCCSAGCEREVYSAGCEPAGRPGWDQGVGDYRRAGRRKLAADESGEVGWEDKVVFRAFAIRGKCALVGSAVCHDTVRPGRPDPIFQPKTGLEMAIGAAEGQAGFAAGGGFFVAPFFFGSFEDEGPDRGWLPGIFVDGDEGDIGCRGVLALPLLEHARNKLQRPLPWRC